MNMQQSCCRILAERQMPTAYEICEASIDKLRNEFGMTTQGAWRSRKRKMFAINLFPPQVVLLVIVQQRNWYCGTSLNVGFQWWIPRSGEDPPSWIDFQQRRRCTMHEYRSLTTKLMAKLTTKQAHDGTPDGTGVGQWAGMRIQNTQWT